MHDLNMSQKRTSISESGTKQNISVLYLYYSSLDASTWSRIKQDIMTVHTRELAAPEERRSKLMGGLIVSVVLSIWIIIGGLYLLYKV